MTIKCFKTVLVAKLAKQLLLTPMVNLIKVVIIVIFNSRVVIKAIFGSLRL